MKVITARNVNDALPTALDILMHHGYERESRNGKVLVYDGPVTTQYLKPRERTLLWEARDANPFFHLYESMYMLSGAASLYPLRWFVKRMETFSDDGQTMQGFYGQRWRRRFGRDQLDIIVRRLRENPDDRRCVLQMWNPDTDLDSASSDVPCNTNAYLAINVHGELDLTVCNRSNDVIWGAYGANVVHMSILQEYLAGRIGVPVGRYWQISNNFHGYLDTVEPLIDADRRGLEPLNPYTELRPPISLVNSSEDPDVLERDIARLAETKPGDLNMMTGLDMFESFFMSTVMLPMIIAYKWHKARNYEEALKHCKLITDDGWRKASTTWMEKRSALYQEA